MVYRIIVFLLIFQSAYAVEFERNKKDLLHKLYSLGSFKTGDFTLKSGQYSSLYIDLRGIISCPEILQQLADCLWQLIDKEKFDVICGVPYAALPVATAISLTHKKPMIIKRKEAKNYGTKKLIEGIYNHGDSCLIIEDVITTGSSILETIQALEQEGLIINDIVVCVDREQAGVEAMRSRGYRVHVLFSLSEIINFTNFRAY